MQHGAPALPQKLVCPHSAPQRKCYQRVKGTSGITCSGSRWTHLTPLTEHCTKLSLPTACHHHLLIITALVLLYSCQASYPAPPPSNPDKKSHTNPQSGAHLDPIRGRHLHRHFYRTRLLLVIHGATCVALQHYCSCCALLVTLRCLQLLPCLLLPPQ
jgi:hypothetical protein